MPTPSRPTRTTRPLPDQVRTIHAFARPVILVDDMLHDGKRIRRLAPLFARQTNTPVDQVLVGYLTGMGRDLMEQLGYSVDAIYYLPNLRLRFVESTLYPFIGGDTVRRSEAPARRPSARRQPHPALRRPRIRRHGRQDRLGALPLLP